jgi:hypothetical protein
MDPLRISERVCARPVGPRCDRPVSPPQAATLGEGGEDIPATPLETLRLPSDFHPTSIRLPSDFHPTSLQTLQTSIRLRSDRNASHQSGRSSDIFKVEKWRSGEGKTSQKQRKEDISKVENDPPAAGRTPPARPSSAALRAVASRPFGPRENPLIYLTGFPVHLYWAPLGYLLNSLMDPLRISEMVCARPVGPR